MFNTTRLSLYWFHHIIQKISLPDFTIQIYEVIYFFSFNPNLWHDSPFSNTSCVLQTLDSRYNRFISKCVNSQFNKFFLSIGQGIYLYSLHIFNLNAFLINYVNISSAWRLSSKRYSLCWYKWRHQFQFIRNYPEGCKLLLLVPTAKCLSPYN